MNMPPATAATAQAPWARTEEPLLWLTGTGHETVVRGKGYHFDCTRRSDPHIGLQMTLAGTGFYERGGRFTALPPGCAFFDSFPGDFRYGYPVDGVDPYEFVWVDFQGETAHQLWRRIVQRTGPVLDLGPGNPLAPLMLGIVHEHAAGRLADRYLASARIYEVLMVILSSLSRTRLDLAPLAQRALAEIQGHGLDPDWGIAQLATGLGVSREHLARAFIAAVGVAPKAYLVQFRLQHAQQLLRDRGLGLEELARHCGFSCANYLCRAFRSRYGLSPGAYRAKPWIRFSGGPPTGSGAVAPGTAMPTRPAARRG